MIVFNEPRWLLLFLLFPLLIWMRFLWRGRGGRVPFSYRMWNAQAWQAPRTGFGLITLISSVLFFTGLAILIIALGEPGVIERKEVHLSRGMDIMIVLDQSPSMGALDLPAMNRFDIAREMIRDFVENRKGDSFGLVSFGSSAVLRSPPTADYHWLLARMDELKIQELGDATAIGMGLATAVLHLSDSTAPEKVIVLLTDGDDNAGEVRPQTAADLALENNIRIYSIGIGSGGESVIELFDEEKGEKIRGMINTRFDETALRSLAETTGGFYWKAGTPGTLETVFRSLDSLETVERRIRLKSVNQPIHRPLIIAALIIISLVFIIRRIVLGETL